MAPPSSPSQDTTDPGTTPPSFSGSDDATVAGDGGPRRTPEPTFARGQSIGRYLLLDPLGQGAMGRVFRAYDPDLDRQVAIKVLHGDTRQAPEHRDRLLGEAKAMARIDHPNVIKVHDAGVHEGSVFIAMAIVEGPSLDRWLGPPRTPAEILDVLTGAARGLAAAHAAGVVHRDFKPANVLVTTDGRAKVGDFGLAGIEDPSTNPSAEEGERGRAIGTPAYMSPEHLVGVSVDARSDQFSFAITLYEALHGTRPFSGTTWPELASNIATGAVVPELAARRRSMDGIIRRALAVDPAERFTSMDELIAAIERTRRPVWRRFAVLGVAALVLGLAALHREPPLDACEAGSGRLGRVWSEADEATLRVEGDDYTKAYRQGTHDRLARSLTDYAEHWAAAYDDACAVVGPETTRGTPAQRHTAQCLENRLDSLRGLVELATSEPLDAGRVGSLVDTLPPIEDCTSGQWVPYPADPELAAHAAELHRTLTRLTREQLADRLDGLDAAARAAEQDARTLGEPYLLALALSVHGEILDDTDAAAARFDEALTVALASGHDMLAAGIVNELLMVSNRQHLTQWREHEVLLAMARELVARSNSGTQGEHLLGNLDINQSNMLRRAGRHEQALAMLQRAEEHFERAGHREGTLRARVNQVIALIQLGRTDDAIPRLAAAVQELEQLGGASSPAGFSARVSLIGALVNEGRTQEALAAAAEHHRRASELYSPHSNTLRRATYVHALSAVNAGEIELAHRLSSTLAGLPGASTRDRIDADVMHATVLQLEGRHEEALRGLADTEAGITPDVSDVERLSLVIARSNSLVVLGRREQLAATLAAPVVQRAFVSRNAPAAELIGLMFAGALGGTPPPGTTWSESLPTARDDTPFVRTMVAVIEALDADDDPTETLRRIRSELAATYNGRDVFVQMLDHWLADHAGGAP